MAAKKALCIFLKSLRDIINIPHNLAIYNIRFGGLQHIRRVGHPSPQFDFALYSVSCEFNNMTFLGFLGD